MVGLTSADLASQALCDSAVKGTAILIVAWIVATGSPRSSAAFRHRVWSLALLGMIVLPVLPFVLPSWDVPVLTWVTRNRDSAQWIGPIERPNALPPEINHSTALQSTEPFTVDSAGATRSLETTRPETAPLPTKATSSFTTIEPPGPVLGVWSLGFLFSLFGIMFGSRQAWRLNRCSQPIVEESWLRLLETLSAKLSLRRHVELREYPHPTIPLTWGLFRPRVLLPRQSCHWNEAMRRAVLLHELAHVQRHDVAYQMLGRVACALYWYHPLAWLALGQMRQEREQACDDTVVHVGERASDYATHLLDVALLYHAHHPLPSSLVVEMARGNQLEQRMAALFNARRSHSPLSRRLSIALLILSTMILCATVMIKPVAQAMAANQDSPKKLSNQEWGVSHEGLRCRILAVSVSSTDSDAENAIAVDRIESPDDLTIAVQLQNTSQRKITLLGPRKPNSPPNEQSTNALAPHLFDVQLTDAHGKPTASPTAVPVLDIRFPTSVMAVELLQPGQSVYALLRPGEFFSPYDIHPPQGEYRLKVRYHGPDQKTVSSPEFQRAHAEFARRDGWCHEVTSNEIALRIADRHTEKLAWGEPTGGLQAAVDCRQWEKSSTSEVPGFPLSNSPLASKHSPQPLINTHFYIRNVTRHPISLTSETARQGDIGLITDEAGEKTKIQGPFFTGFPIVYRWTLQPDDVIRLSSLNGGSHLLDKPGRFHVSYQINFGNLGSNSPDDFRQVLATGETLVVIRDRQEPDNVEKSNNDAASGAKPNENANPKSIECAVHDERTGDPIRGATILLRFLKPRTGIVGLTEVTPPLAFHDVGTFTVNLPADITDTKSILVERSGTHPDYQTLPPSMMPLEQILRNEPANVGDFLHKIRLSPGVVVTGKVMDLDGRPAPGVPVFSGRNRSGWGNGAVHRTLTDVDGRFRLIVPNRFGRGRIYLAPLHAAAVSRAITEDYGEQQLFQLRPGTRLTGRVVDHDGRGVADVIVRANAGERIPFRYARTDADGHYSLPPCAAGNYMIDLLDEGLIPDEKQTGTRLPDVYLRQNLVLAKDAAAEQVVNFEPTRSVRVTVDCLNGKESPVSGLQLTVAGGVQSTYWTGRLREDSHEPGRYDGQVPRGIQRFQIHQTPLNGTVLRIPGNRTLPVNDDDNAFLIHQLKTAQVTLRATLDGKPFDLGTLNSPTPRPRFADENLAKEIGATEPTIYGLEHRTSGTLRAHVHPEIDLTIQFEGPGIKPKTINFRAAEGENLTLDVALESIQ